MRSIDATIDARGMGKVLVDGVDQAEYVEAVTIRARTGQATVVEIDHIANVHVGAEGLVIHHAYVGPFHGKGATFRAAVEDVLAQVVAEEDAA